MKVVILAGGRGTRISEESHLKPKPMVDIGEKPILWHIMKLYSHFGLRDFVICLGYKGYSIKEYFAHYLLHESDVTFDFTRPSLPVTYHQSVAEAWRVTLVETGLETGTGGRVRRVRPHLGGETFMLTYGDGLARIDVDALLAFHRAHGKLATVTATQPGGRFGSLEMGVGDAVSRFREKPAGDGAWINAGFFVLEPGVLEYISDDETMLEQEPLDALARDGQLMAYRHCDFWQPMDTLRDRDQLARLWQSGHAPWKLWE